MAQINGKITVGRGVFLADKIRGDAIAWQQVRRSLVDDLNTLDLLKQNDGGTIGTGTANALGAATVDDAQALYDELNSLCGKINNPDPTANVQAVHEATDQFANKVR